MNTRESRSSWSAALAVALPVGLGIFLLVVVTSTLITFTLPITYSSTARVKVSLPAPLAASAPASGQGSEIVGSLALTEAEVIASESILQLVVTQLDLNRAWGRKYGFGDELKSSTCVEILRRRLEVRPVRNTSVITIRAESDKPAEAAVLANAVADAYMKSTAATPNGPGITLLDRAHPIPVPVRPNRPLNIVLGMLVGAVLGGGAGVVCGGVVALRRRAAPKMGGGLPPPLPRS